MKMIAAFTKDKNNDALQEFVDVLQQFHNTSVIAQSNPVTEEQIA